MVGSQLTMEPGHIHLHLITAGSVPASSTLTQTESGPAHRWPGQVAIVARSSQSVRCLHTCLTSGFGAGVFGYFLQSESQSLQPTAKRGIHEHPQTCRARTRDGHVRYGYIRSPAAMFQI